MPKRLQQHLRTITEHYPELRRSYHVKKIGVFGSVARGEDTKKSDIDILIDLQKPIGLFRFVDLENHLSKILKKKVDLVTRNALKPAIKKNILQDVVYAQTQR